MTFTLNVRNRFFLLGSLDAKRVLIFGSDVSRYYFFLSDKIKLRKKDKAGIVFTSSDYKDASEESVIACLNKIQTFFKFYTKILFLKGLGFKMKYDDSCRILELKVGLSHIWYVEVPASINFILKKNLLIFRSYENSGLGSYVSKIKRLCKSNAYNQRGIFSSTDILKLKPITKKK